MKKFTKSGCNSYRFINNTKDTVEVRFETCSDETENKSTSSDIQETQTEDYLNRLEDLKQYMAF